MDRVLIEQKLESLRRAVKRVKAKCPEDVQTLIEDYDAQDILSLNYEAINWAIVYSLSQDRLVDFEEYARAIVNALDKELSMS